MSNTRIHDVDLLSSEILETVKKNLVSLVLSLFSRSHDHQCFKSLSQTMTVDAHCGIGVKIHTSRSMASTIS
jgi:hypothetical protein